MISEKQLIKSCQEGIKQSQYLLVKRYSAMLMTVCRRYARDDAMAKDVLQESFIRIFKYIGDYKPTGSFEAWMRRIAVRSALQWIEKGYFKREASTEELPDERLSEPDVYHYLGTEVILQKIQELPEGYRTIFNLNIIEGYSHKEIAALLNITENTSRSQLVRARRLLQQKLNKEEQLLFDRESKNMSA